MKQTQTYSVLVGRKTLFYETSEGLEKKNKQSARANVLDLFANVHNTPTLAKQKRGLVFINLPAFNSNLSVLKVWVG